MGLRSARLERRWLRRSFLGSVDVLNVTTGLDATYFPKESVGINLRLQGFAGPIGRGDSGYSHGVSFDLGLAFSLL